MLIDTHTHFYLKEFDNDREGAVKRAIEAGVSKLLLPNVEISSIADMMKLVEQFPLNCFPMIGIHPCYIKDGFEKDINEVKKQLNMHHFYAIGEIGLDYYWDTTYSVEQKKALAIQLDIADKYNLPAVIHVRDSFDDTLEIVQHSKVRKGVFHCLSGNTEQALQVIALGFKIGVGGVVTYKNAGLTQVVANIGLEHIVLETDAPYLAPVPYRGKRNESSYLNIIAQKIAEIKGENINKVIEVTTATASELFELKT